MSWIKGQQLFFWNQYDLGKSYSHASVPFAVPLQGNEFMLYFGARNSKGQSLPFCIKAQIINGQFLLIGEPMGPLMDVGQLGTFDDSGVMPTCVVRHNGQYWMYYIGWNPQVTVSYRLSIGLAISDDGIHFKRYSQAPLLDRSLDEIFFNTAPFVLKNVDGWEMYYVSCTDWKILEGRTEPQYTIKRASSTDGIYWERENKALLDYDERGEAFGRPCVLTIENDKRALFFSFRKLSGYREFAGNAYQTTHALWDSQGKKWIKQYQDTLPLGHLGDWDEQMACYGHVFQHEGKFWMLYNGNDFGKTGFGYAQWIIE